MISSKNLRRVSLCLFLPCALLLGGCPPAVFLGGTAVGAAANDERSVGSLVEDQEIELKAAGRLDEAIGDGGDLSVVSYNRRVLIVGQVASRQLRRDAVQVVRGIPNVVGVVDKMEIGGATSLAAGAADAALTAKVKTELCRAQLGNFSCLDVKVVSEQSVVYLLGLVTKKQAADAVAIARDIKGVKKVVKVFEYRKDGDGE